MWPFQRGPGTYNILKFYYKNRWIPGANNKDARFPAVTPGNNTNNFRASSVYLLNAAYLRLKVAQIAYTLPVKLTQKIGASAVQFFINGTNLLIWSPIKFTNPEDLGNGTGFYPLQRAVNFGLQINFN